MAVYRIIAYTFTGFFVQLYLWHTYTLVCLIAKKKYWAAIFRRSLHFMLCFFLRCLYIDDLRLNVS